MPKIIEKSISILSDAGLGMAMFSLGEWIMRLICIFLSLTIYISIYVILFVTFSNSFFSSLKT